MMPTSTQAPWRRSPGPARATALFIAMLIGGCGGTTSDTHGAVDRAYRLIDVGDAQGALAVGREVVASTPNDPGARTALGSAELAAGQPALAEVSLRKALELGATSDQISIPLAESLLAQGKVLEAKAQIGDLQSHSVESRFPLAVLRAEAELRTPGAARVDVIRAFVDANRRQPVETTNDAIVREVRRAAARLAALRIKEPLAADGEAHFRCRSEAAAANTDTPGSVTAGAPAQGRRLLQVGPTRAIKRPSEAARIARDGDVIEIDAGAYHGDVAVWGQSRISLRGVGGRPHLEARGRSANDQGIWVFRGNDITVENVGFSGARASGRNGSGIRFLGRNLTIRDSVFHDNEAGLLTRHDPESDILVERSVFYRNGYGDGQSHNIYIGRIRSFTLRFSHTHDSHVGHNVKSRAATSHILYNRITDELDGDSSYLIDLPEGGAAFIVGNELQKGIKTENRVAIAYAAERGASATGQLLVAHNSHYNRRPNSTFVRNWSERPVTIANNVMTGAPLVVLQGKGEEWNNFLGAGHGLEDPAGLSFMLTAESPLIDAGRPPPSSMGEWLSPEFEYVHPVSGRVRAAVAARDIGAHEFCGW